MKFLCDEMLAGLARWLRAAGYDAELGAAGETDRALLQRAQVQDRILLTRDRAILLMKDAPRSTIVLHGETLDDWARELTKVCGLHWLHRPMSRCLVCNADPVEADEQALARMPEDSRALPGPFMSCPACKRGYWPGSHVKRMMAKLEYFASNCGHAPLDTQRRKGHDPRHDH